MKRTIVDLKNNIMLTIETKPIFTGPAHDYLIECDASGSSCVTKVNKTYVLRNRINRRGLQASKLNERVLTEEEAIKIIYENELDKTDK